MTDADARRPENSTTDPNSRRRRSLRAASAVALVLIGCAGAVIAWGLHTFYAQGPLRETVTLVIPKKLAVEAIARRLADAGIVSAPIVFSMGARMTGQARNLRAGEYAFPAGISQKAILDLLESGRTILRRLTVPEGLMTAQVVALLNQTEALDGTLSERPGEGTLLPETYHYSLGDERRDLVKRMESAMQQALAELWPRRAPDLPFATPYEALILASIIEKETGIESERPRVAAVFINRLRLGMKLDADPTVAYALTHGRQPLDRPLRRADLAFDDPYNTYVYAGLPPGPIACPGRAALAAALNPAMTKDLYFVADGKGGHAFAETLSEHNQNVARFRRVKRD